MSRINKTLNVKRFGNIIITTVLFSLILTSFGFSDITFKTEDESVIIVLTPDGDIVSNVDVKDIDDGGFSPVTGDLRIKYEGSPKLYISENEVYITNQINEDSECPLFVEPLIFIDRTEQPCAQMILTTDGDLHIDKEILTIDEIANQPTYVRTLINQVFNDNYPMITTTYFDGLGREIQSQLLKSYARSITSGTYYDAIGRPFKQTKLANIQTIFSRYIPMNDQALIEKANEFYDDQGLNTDHAFREMEYFEDPLTRTHAIGMPGEEFSLDNSDEHYSKVWHFGVTGSNELLGHDDWFDSDGFILANKLNQINEPIQLGMLEYLLEVTSPEELKYYLTVVRDPNGNFSQKLIDILGNVVRTWAYTETDYSTHDESKVIMAEYLYDIEGNVMLEMPPKIDPDDPINTDIAPTTYLYNTQGQVYEKQSPDAGNEQYEYDEAGRLAKIIKPNNNQIIFMYDYLSRVKDIYEYVDQEQISYPKIANFYDNTFGIEDYLPGNIPDLSTVLGMLKNLRGRVVANISVYRDETAGEDKYVIDLSSYNIKGNIESKYKYIPGLTWQKISFEYDFTGNIKSKSIEPQFLSVEEIDPLVIDFEYDNLNRLNSIKDNKTRNSMMEYEYNEIGLLKQKKFINSQRGEHIATVNNTYNIRDWIKNIHTTGEDNYFKFTEDIKYTEVNAQYNGNISHVQYEYSGINSGGEDYLIDIEYFYDGVNRLIQVESDDGTAGYARYDEAFSYDNIGRIRQTRRDNSSLENFYENMYHYIEGTNRLSYVSHKQTDGNYSYDQMGNMTVDESKDMDVEYDWRDMPVKFKLREGTGNYADIKMVYDASGNRVLKFEETTTEIRSVAYVDDELVYETDDFQDYDNSDFRLTNAYIPNGEGRIDFDNNKVSTKYLFVKDHLGTTRAVLTDEGELVKADMYFAYGAKDPLQIDASSTKFRKEFTGKEFDDDGASGDDDDGMNLYYFGARFYDPEIVMWTSPDPMDEFWNSYSYVGGNPIRLIDPVGLQIGCPPGGHQGGWVEASNGEVFWFNPLDMIGPSPKTGGSTSGGGSGSAGSAGPESISLDEAVKNKSNVNLDDFPSADATTGGGDLPGIVLFGDPGDLGPSGGGVPSGEKFERYEGVGVIEFLDIPMPHGLPGSIGIDKFEGGDAGNIIGNVFKRDIGARIEANKTGINQVVPYHIVKMNIGGYKTGDTLFDTISPYK